MEIEQVEQESINLGDLDPNQVLQVNNEQLAAMEP